MCPEGITWEDAAARLRADATTSAVVDSFAAGEPCLFVAILTSRGSSVSTQGAALPGMQLAAVMAAIKGAGCPLQLASADTELQAALARFGYSVDAV